MRSVRTKVMGTAGVSLAVALGVAGCGTAQQISAKDSVSDAVQNLNDAKSATFDVSLDTTTADLIAISKAEGDPISASDQKSVQQMINGDVLFAVNAPAGKTFGDAAAAQGSSQDFSNLIKDPAALSAALKKQGAFSMTVRLSGGSLIELRSLDGVIYFRADVAKLTALSGSSSTADFNSMVAQLPASLSAIKKAARGQWVSLDLVKAAQALKDSPLASSLGAAATASPTVDSTKVTKLMNDLKAAYDKNASIAKIDSTSDGQGYELTAPAKQIATAVQPDLIALAGSDSAADIKSSIAKMPDKKVKIDVYVKDKQLTRVKVDLTQFLDKPVTGKKLNLDLGIDVGAGQVTAPSGATEIDVKAIMNTLSGALGSGGLSTGSGASTGSGTVSGTSGKLTKAEIQQLRAAGLTNAQIRQMEAARESAGK